MPTNDERRKVADNLRDYEQDMLELYRLIIKLIDPGQEPTCRMRFDSVHCDLVCSRCGAWVRTDASSTIDGASLKFCPNCGAKVVSDAD